MRAKSNEYQHDRDKLGFKILCILVLWTKVASALEGLSSSKTYSTSIISWPELTGHLKCMRQLINVEGL